MRISLDNFNGEKLLTSPRSLEACRLSGIEPSQLLKKPRTLFEMGAATKLIAQRRMESFEEQRTLLVALAVRQREDLKVLEASNDRSSSLSSVRPEDNSGHGLCTPIRKLGGTAAMSPSPSLARISRLREEEDSQRRALSERTTTALDAASQRRQRHFDAVAGSASAVKEKIAVARERLTAHEISERKALEAKLSERLRTVEHNKSSLLDSRCIHIAESNATTALKRDEAKKRVAAAERAKSRALLSGWRMEEQRVAEATRRIVENNIARSQERRLKTENTLLQARFMRARLDSFAAKKLEHKANMIEEKCASVERSREQASQLKQLRFQVKRRKINDVEAIRKRVTASKHEAAHKSRENRDEMLSAKRLERQLLAEAKREMLEVRQGAALRAKKAQEYRDRLSKAARSAVPCH